MVKSKPKTRSSVIRRLLGTVMTICMVLSLFSGVSIANPEDVMAETSGENSNTECTDHVYSTTIQWDGDWSNPESVTAQLVSQCVQCGASNTAFVPKDAEVTVIYATASCIEDGVITYEAKAVVNLENGKTRTYLYTTTVPAQETGHDYEKTGAKDATCEEPGHIAYQYCKRCEKYFNANAGKYADQSEWIKDSDGVEGISKEDTIIKATNHNPEKHDAVAATCETEGHKTYYQCTNTGCGTKFKDKACRLPFKDKEEIVKKLEHKYTAINSYRPADCQKDGNVTYSYCTRCAKYFIVGLKDKDDKFTQITDGKLTDDKKILVYNNGTDKISVETLAYQSVDGKTDVVIPRLSATDIAGHNLSEIIDYKKPSCVTEGNAAYAKCSGCARIFKIGYKKDETGEFIQIVDGKVNGENVEYNGGKNTIAKTKLEYLPATMDNMIINVDPVNGHTMGTIEDYKAPTCSNKGTKSYAKCKDCSQLLAIGYTDVEGEHWIEDGVVSGENITFTSGDTSKEILTNKLVWKVTNEDSLTIPADKGAHHFAPGNIVNANAPTCEQKGNVIYAYCDDCSEIFLVGYDSNKVKPVNKTTGEATEEGKFVQIIHGIVNSTEDDWEIRYEDQDQKWHTIARSDLIFKPAGDKSLVREALEHEYVEYTKAEADGYTTSGEKPMCFEATCTEPAKYYTRCKRCGKYSKDTFPIGIALGHDTTGGYVSYDPATCTEDGTKAHWICQRSECGKTFKYDETNNEFTTKELEDPTIPATGHDFVKSDNPSEENLVKKATCTERARYRRTCKNCGEEDKVSLEEAIYFSGERLHHSYTVNFKWDDNHKKCTAEFECTNAGCTDKTPGHKITKVVEAGGSDYSRIQKDEADNSGALCNKARKVTYKAIFDMTGVEGFDPDDEQFKYKAEEEVRVSNQGIEHVYKEYQPNNNATCEENGTETSKCCYCSETYTREKDGTALGHDYQKPVLAFSEDGKTCAVTIGCTRCAGKTDKAVVTSKVVKKATCLEKGKTEYTATFENQYGDTETYTDTKVVEDIPATGHAWEVVAAKEATCTEDGNIAYWHCKTCDKYFGTDATDADDTKLIEDVNDDGKVTLADTVIPKKGHDYNIKPVSDTQQFKWTVDENNNVVATADFVCANDPEHVVTRDVVVTVKVTDATCTVAGEAVYTGKVSYEGKKYSEDRIEKGQIEALGHKYGAGVIIKEPTCTADGTKEYTCTVCEDKKTETISKLGHVWNTEFTVDEAPTCTTEGKQSKHCARCDEIDTTTVESIDKVAHKLDSGKVTTAPTCTKDGVKTFTCTVCKEAIKTEPVAATGHNWADTYTVDKAPTCTKEGSRSIHCKNCDATRNEEAIKATGHSLDEGKETTAPTCTKDGVKTFTCTVCKEAIKTEAIKATGHAYDEGEVIAEPTCTETGEIVYVCTVCDDEKTEVLDALGHDWEDGFTVDIKPTCTKEGQKSVHCKREDCYRVRNQVAIPATGHKAETVMKDATCTEDGVKTTSCTVCKEVLDTEVIKAKGHTYDEGEVIVDPTCTDEGKKILTCTECRDEKEEVIPKLGHDWEDDFTVDKEATCTEEGQKSIHCKREGCYNIRNAEPIVKKAHSLDEGKITEEPTCTEKGVKTYTCTECDQVVKTEEVKALGHVSDEGKITEEPTCTKDGVKTYTCTACAEVVKTEEVKALGHVSDEGKITEEPTCTSKGVKTYTCTVCDEIIKTELVPALGHVSDEGKITEEPTCTEKGVKTYTCTVCDQVLKTEDVDALGHDWAEDYTVDEEPTCTEEGQKSIHCTREDCKEVKDTVAIPAKGHQYNEGEVTTAPTCTEKGVKTFTCSVCGDEKEEEIPALGHTWEEDFVVDKAPTCTEPGTKTIYCKDCNAVKETQEIPALGHVAGEPVIENKVEATCDKDGSYDKVVYCTVCNKEISREKVEVKALGHKFTNYVNNNDATTSKDATETAVCDVCGDATDTRSISGTKISATDVNLALNSALQVTQTGSTINVKWGKVNEASQYLVYAGYCGKSYDKPITVKGSTSLKISKLGGKSINYKGEYTVYVKAVKVIDGKSYELGKTLTTHVVGAKNATYANPKAIQLSSTSVSVKVKKTAKISAKVVLTNTSKKPLGNAHEKELRYASSNTKVAKVSSTGVIKGVAKGTCTVYVYARNGFAKKIKVTVK